MKIYQFLISSWPTVITILYFTVVTLFVTTGCDKFEKTEEFYVDVEIKVEAKVENASKFSNVVAVILVMHDRSVNKTIELARGEWKDGGFTIELSKMLNQNYFTPLTNYIGLQPTQGNIPPTLNISNRNVKIGNIDFQGVDEDDKVVALFTLSKIDENGSLNPNGVVYFTYVDADVNISGYREFLVTDYANIHDGPILYKWKTTMNYSIEWKKGLNAWLATGAEFYQEKTRTLKWSTISTSDLRWFGR